MDNVQNVLNFVHTHNGIVPILLCVAVAGLFFWLAAKADERGGDFIRSWVVIMCCMAIAMLAIVTALFMVMFAITDWIQ